MLDRDDEAAEIRFQLCETAQHEIQTAYFIFDDDGIGMATLNLLRAAAERGVSVRLVIDSQWNRIAGPVLKALLEDGVQIRLYHPWSVLRPFDWTRRMHDKLLIVDGEHLVLGGRNIEDAYFGLGKRNYLDRDVYIQGAAAGEAQRYFRQLWQSRHVRLPSLGFVHPEETRRARRRLDMAFEALAARNGAPSGRRDWPAGIDVGGVRFLHDPVTGKRKRHGIRADLQEILDSAEDSIAIESPYLVITKNLRKTFQAALARGVQIRILTNSLAATDNVYAQAGYAGRRKRLVGMGIELWEYPGPRSLHSKSALIDDRLVIIGSYNIDPRSERLNTEVAVVIEDESAAQELSDSFERNLEVAWPIGPDGKPRGHEKRYPGASFVRKTKLRVVRLLVPFIRRQL